MDYFWIGIGAAVGANGRYLVGQAVANRLGGSYPYGTLIVNVTGSFLIGLVMVVLTERMALESHWRLLLVVGVLGGYTTFSSFSNEAITLLQQDRLLAFASYVGFSTGFSLLACYGGIVLARAMVTR